MVRFIDREYEMSLLDRDWEAGGAVFEVICGRRRIGKTRLITEFIKDRDGIFFIAEDVNKKVQINELKNKIADFLEDDFLRTIEITEWKDLFEYLGRVLPEKKRFYIALDEFSYIIKNDTGVPSVLQKFWDTFLSNTQIFFLVSGSIFGLMQDKILSSTSPLYGRRTRDLLVRPLSFQNSAEFLKMPFEEKLKVYMTIGGVPEYLLKARNYRRVNAFLNAEFLKRDGYFYREPYFLLSQEFKEIKTYFTILNAISYGNTRPTEIANFAGLKSREIYPYLENLIRLGFIKRISPLIGKRRRGIYMISDEFFDFWFNFVFANREKIERDRIEIERLDANPYFGKRFEILVREELFHNFFDFDMVGRWWHRDREIDIVALKEDTILFGECKWKGKVNAERVVRALVEKAEYVPWNNESRTEEFVVFAKSFSKKIDKLKGKDVHCLDLKDLENFKARP
jgi:AAA+ ATPase superfamily predicted ATPase